MGLLSTAMFGAAAGAGETGAKGYLQEQSQQTQATSAQNLEMLRQQLTAEREQRNIRLTGEQSRQTQAEKPEILPAGSTIQRPGQTNFQAPEKPQSEEEKALLRAHANYYNSAARAASAKEPKAILPKIVPLKDEMGNIIAVLDENTGAVGTPNPGSPAKEAVSHWFSANEAAKPAVPAGLTWVGPDRQPIAGIHVFYPDMLKRGVGTGTGATPATQPAARPSLASFMPGAQAAPQAPARAPAPAAPPQAQPVAQAPALPQGPASGNAVDAARTKLSAAQQTLQSFGLMQQKRDPQGFAAAQQAVAAAKQDLDSSMSQYQNDLGPVGAGRPLLRMK